ncbi:hypothetical protein BAE44_0007775 [Dichanthelium oligosanthes]|uniref:Uncharacterized protein n=1 Tax=Dichanthelium oligosanthes TaxID=888268 RepID=A0A1E5W1C5_9POAL|nr:hypothetical protein BAE44_0007775 [Dichanthelium oligosanthes]
MEKLRSSTARALQEVEKLRSRAAEFDELMERPFDVVSRGVRVFGALARDVVIIVSLGYIAMF